METVNEMCGDNRFEVIRKAKEHLIEATNIETSPDEMKVLDSFLFRAWQMGWLSDYDPDKTAIMRGCIMDCKNCWKMKLVNPVQEWVSVDERLPDLIPCNAGTAYSEAVNIWTSGRKVMVAIWDGTDFLCDADYWEAEGELITHWKPIEPPKGVQ